MTAGAYHGCQAVDCVSFPNIVVRKAGAKGDRSAFPRNSQPFPSTLEAPVATVDLRAVVDAMDLPSPTWESYLDPDSGEIVTVTDADRTAIDHAEADLATDWRDEMLPRVREALESDHFLMLPDQYDIHEWSIMKRFALTQRNADVRHELLDTLYDKGAWRLFQRVLNEHDLTEDWQQFRTHALEHVAQHWLTQHGLEWQ